MCICSVSLIFSTSTLMCDVLRIVMSRYFYLLRDGEGPFGTSCCPARIVGFKARRNAAWATGHSVPEQDTEVCLPYTGVPTLRVRDCCVEMYKAGRGLSLQQKLAPTWQCTSSVATCVVSTGD